MKSILIIWLMVIGYGNQYNITAQDAKIATGRYCFDGKKYGWILKRELGGYFSFTSELTKSERVMFKYGVCYLIKQEEKVCSSDDKNYTLTFSNLKSELDCNGNKQFRYNSVKFEHGSSSPLTGAPCCNNQ